MGQNPDQDCIAYITKMIGRPGDWKTGRLEDSTTFECHGRTASYPTAPAQIPACGTTALGSSEILASVKVKLIRYLNWLRKLRNSRFLDIIKSSNLVKYIIAETTFLATTIQPLI